MDNQICLRFDKLRNYLPDDFNISKSSDIHTLGSAKKYCPIADSENKCETNADKINAGFLWLFEQNIINRITDFKGSSDKKHKSFIIYIMIWLSYMLSLKKVNNINNLNEFYGVHIKDNTHYNTCIKKEKDCSNSLKDSTEYMNFKEFIEANKCLMDIKFEDVSNLYDAFKLLCEMYTGLSANNRTDKRYLNNAKDFVKKYNELNKHPNITKDSPYYQVLSTLSNDYNNFKKYCKNNKNDCNDIPSLSPIKIKENIVQSSAHDHVQNTGAISSSSSIANKLIPVLSIFAAIPIFVGIAYKYSLFGFRKRSQKHHLREKIKK
ncbi:PIR protein [Plasmodium yoelii]|uniref:Yir1 protein n=3 Tax=Plasmodium yoelii TaxID=5861 RepID=Q7RBB5_PLAYO|nr:PIR protein [Plasmodium yoelii]EAA18409.1 putative yir1 protein [Plasmodium yoelii yoelii]WBY55190.1 PIR protein [Plasmodium yoelii yoelii]CDS44500.1 YIR protein [Plasmodium yoelii]VTZ73111.1 PIR protein [Plasmodium yoelii]|eukprot:XP_022810857.1 PIR protein [Plasmodium yoelii]